MTKEQLYLLEKLSKEDYLQHLSYTDMIKKAEQNLRFRLDIGVKAI